MEMVIAYFRHTVLMKPEGFPWNAAMPKILHLVKEIKALTFTSIVPVPVSGDTVFNSDGEEVIEESDLCKEINQKCNKQKSQQPGNIPVLPSKKTNRNKGKAGGVMDKAKKGGPCAALDAGEQSNHQQIPH
ncbi:hypothetical protein BDQ17DRAFT_1427449 [Cyathus striatus]|nr:hypothetical protein BDQ17DRAFT_1427449 [Cyathus striatus]